MVWFGCTTCLASLVLASFATQVWHLIVTQGALFGTGFLVLYYPVLSMLQEWFVERRGLAFGIIFGATGVAGAALPFLINHLLLNYGFASTLRYYAVGAGILLGATLPFCNPRNPIRKAKPIEWSLYWTLATKPAFLLFWIANLFQGVAFFLPSFNIPSKHRNTIAGHIYSNCEQHMPDFSLFHLQRPLLFSAG
jgi:MFS family permease